MVLLLNSQMFVVSHVYSKAILDYQQSITWYLCSCKWILRLPKLCGSGSATSLVVSFTACPTRTRSLIDLIYDRSGTKWIADQVSTQAECEMVGLCDNTPTLKVLCDSQYTCTDGVSGDQDTCESNGTCNDFDGCVFDWDQDLNCNTSFDWTPLGCLSRIINDNNTCIAQGG